MNNYKAGLFEEFIARMWLRLHGYSIVKCRHITGRYTGCAEVDIIALRKNTLIFVEVKKRPSAVAGMDAITHAQGERLRRAGMLFIRRTRWTGDARFDVIVISGWKIKWFKNAI